jgi:hypothetical protein
MTTFARVYEVSIAWLSGGDAEDDGVDDRVRLAARELAKLKSADLDKILNLLSTMRQPRPKR